MDDQVREAMARWPGVPDVFGWLRLTRRGQWMLVDRNRPDFDEDRHGAGSPITSPPILEFIARNYQADAFGRWHWQNGPQRVFVDIDLAPLILRVTDLGTRRAFLTHTGVLIERIDAVQTDAEGVLYVFTELGPCAVHDLDLAQLEIDFDESDAPALLRLADRRYLIMSLDPSRLDFVRRPRPL